MKQKQLRDVMERISRLPDDKVQQVQDFAEFLLSKYENEILNKAMAYAINESDTFSFLNEEEELYSAKDLKEKYQ